MALLRQPALVVIDAPGLPPGRQIVLPIGRRIVVGRRRSADITIPDSTIGPRHARVEVGMDSEVDLVDEQSTNGTFVDGVWIEGRVRLARGARIGFARAATFEFTRLGTVDPDSIRRCPACRSGLDDRSEFAPRLLVCSGCHSVVDLSSERVEMTGASLMRFVGPFVDPDRGDVRECIERLAATAGAPLWLLKLPEVAPLVAGYQGSVRVLADLMFEPGAERRLQAAPAAIDPPQVIFARGARVPTLGFAGFEVAVILKPRSGAPVLLERLGLMSARRHPANYALAPISLVEPDRGD